MVGLIAAACLGGCSSKGVDPGQSGAGPIDGVLLLPRAEIVARADELASRASREPREAAALLLQAAALREQIYRLERRKADALEAIELMKEAAEKGECGALVRAAAFRAEVEVEPGLVSRMLGERGRVELSPECRTDAKRVGDMLGLSGVGLSVPRTAASSDGSSSSPRQVPEVVAPTLVAGQRAGTPRVLGVERYGAKDTARIVVLMSEPATFRAGLLRADAGSVGARLYVDIDRAELQGQADYPVGGVVQGVRLGKQAGGVRVVLDLEESVERRVFYMPEPFRLIIDVARGGTAAKLRASGPRVLERVVIDPGHGGHDPGAIGPRGLREKDVTLDIAHRAAPLIARELGLSTLLTRDTDTYVPLDERTARANAFRADLFVSIHCNAAEQTGSDGVVTFVLDTSSDAAASRVAALENAASAAAARELANSLAPVQDEGILARSLHFAELLQRSTVASLSKDYGRIPNQGVRRAGFYVLAGAHMPAVLYEVSFISNPDGEVRLNTADYRQRLADSIVNAVRAFRDGL
jgi:N-acetylmuramoyl-L-alanine amidase